jgi:hypothetical protein
MEFLLLYSPNMAYPILKNMLAYTSNQMTGVKWPFGMKPAT